MFVYRIDLFFFFTLRLLPTAMVIYAAIIHSNWLFYSQNLLVENRTKTKGNFILVCSKNLNINYQKLPDH